MSLVGLSSVPTTKGVTSHRDGTASVSAVEGSLKTSAFTCEFRETVIEGCAREAGLQAPGGRRSFGE